MSALRVELVWDDESSNWHYRVPALRVNGFVLEGDPRDCDTDAETVALDVTHGALPAA